jgi:tRNA 2-thiouridine synthesizing protein A
MPEISANRVLDARGLQCPMPVVKTSQEIKTMQIGEVLQVLATDPGSMADITAWSKSTGNELMGMERGAGVFTFYIKRLK